MAEQAPAPGLNIALLESPRHDRLRDRILDHARRARHLHGFPALGLGVVLDGEVVCCRTLGDTAPAPGDAAAVPAGWAAADTPARSCEVGAAAAATFGLGSTSKLLPVVAALNLAEQGRVHLDADVNDYLRGLRVQPPAGSAPVTVRHLLTHTAGLASWRRRGDLFRWGTNEVLRPGARRPELAEFYRGRVRPMLEAGQMFLYSDHSSALLGQVIADVTGQSMARTVHENVLAPLGMTRTGYPPYQGIPHPKPGHGPDGAPQPTLRHVLTAPTSAISTVADMTLFGWALSHGGSHPAGRVLGADMAALVLQPALRLHPRFPALGMQFIVAGSGATPRVGVMRGACCGWVSWLAVSADLRLAVLVLANRHHPLDQLAETVVAEVTGRHDLALRSATVPPRAPTAGSAIPPTGGRLTGVYAPLPPERFPAHTGMDLMVLANRAGVRTVDMCRRGSLPRSRALRPVPGEPDLYLVAFPWADVYVLVRRGPSGRVRELVFSPFDRYRRVPGWEVPLLPLRRVATLATTAVLERWWRLRSLRSSTRDRAR